MRLLSDDYGKHLMGVEDLLQKHSLVEADINVLGDRVKAVVQNSQRFISDDADTSGLEGYRPADPAAVMERVQQLEVIIQLSKNFSCRHCVIVLSLLIIGSIR